MILVKKDKKMIMMKKNRPEMSLVLLRNVFKMEIQ